jgi:Flp pilus assembly pilin Flp
MIMKKFLTLFRDLHEDKSGASFIEYTALLGVILAVGLVVLAQVGTWANGTWTYLCTTLGSTAVAC